MVAREKFVAAYWYQAGAQRTRKKGGATTPLQLEWVKAVQIATLPVHHL